MSAAAGTVLWWGRFDPDYSRNRILRQAYAALGWRVVDFQPWLSAFGDVEALPRRAPRADLVHVPCFRQRDIAAACRYARRRGLPLLVDPLISAYDKQVFERGKLAEGSARARRLQRAEQRLLQSADAVLADTPEHARFFAGTLGVDPARLHVVYVGAEETLFAPGAARAPNPAPEVLFYGSFIALQGPEVIVEAARRYQGPPVRWTLLGEGPLHDACRQQAAGLGSVTFAPWVPYALLPARIRQADILLGVFGATPKAQRVIPNKVFQALACGKPLVTCRAPAYPAGLLEREDSGIRWVPAGDAEALAQAVAGLAAQPQRFATLGAQARASYERFFAVDKVQEQLRAALAAPALKRG
jgi:glycosyltransferase involved in cell wall biosynthesis